MPKLLYSYQLTKAQPEMKVYYRYVQTKILEVELLNFNINHRSQWLNWAYTCTAIWISLCNVKPVKNGRLSSAAQLNGTSLIVHSTFCIITLWWIVQTGYENTRNKYKLTEIHHLTPLTILTKYPVKHSVHRRITTNKPPSTWSHLDMCTLACVCTREWEMQKSSGS